MEDSIFSAEKVNSGRQIEWDYIKFLAIILLIMVHYFAFCSIGYVDYGIIPDYLYILAQISAPIFMFAMGVGMIYTRHDSPKEFVIRGIKLILLGLVINTMYFLSNYAAGMPLEYALLSFLANDILQFAGLSFIVIGIFKRIDLSIWQMLTISLMLSLIGSYMYDITFSNIYLTQFLGNIIGTYDMNVVSCFPIFHWLIIPVSGMVFGEFLIRCRNKDTLYKKIFKNIWIIVLILYIVGFATRISMFSTVGGTVPEKLGYLHGSLQDMIVLIMTILLLVSIFYFISKRMPSKIENFVVRTSKNVTIIYVIQWAIILLLIYYSQFLDIEATLSITVFLLLLITVASIGLAEVYVKIKEYLKTKFHSSGN